jgi:HD-GYP domain-containing protein (c-di-GMP phosphodiesterase class II)
MSSVPVINSSDATPTQSQFLSIEVNSMQVGATLRAPIYDDDDSNSLLLLLATGTTLTESLLTRLKRRGVSNVLVHRSEANRLVAGAEPRAQSDGARQLIGRATVPVQHPANSRWSCTASSFVHKIATHGAQAYDAAAVAQFTRNYKNSLRQVERLFDGLAQGDIGVAASLAAVSSESLMRIADDLDLFVALGLEPATDRYPCKHSLQTAMVAMSIGTILGLKPEELIELGIGCLVHDAGMLKIHPKVANAKRSLTKIEFLEITKHPTLSFDALRYVNGVPNGSRLVAYQMHERLDGSGYPRRRTANQIHYLAKIAAVADVYVALVSPRPYRPAMLAYHAIEQILHGARKGLYDPAVVRALLHTISLFPIGSYVEMSDGRIAKVVRSNRDAYMSPVVEVIDSNAGGTSGQIVDLYRNRDQKIARAIPDVAATPIR